MTSTCPMPKPRIVMCILVDRLNRGKVSEAEVADKQFEKLSRVAATLRISDLGVQHKEKRTIIDYRQNTNKKTERQVVESGRQCCASRRLMMAAPRRDLVSVWS